MFNLDPLGKSHVSKERTQKTFSIPACILIFFFPHVLGSDGTFFWDHRSFFQCAHGGMLIMVVHPKPVRRTVFVLYVFLF